MDEGEETLDDVLGHDHRRLEREPIDAVWRHGRNHPAPGRLDGALGLSRGAQAIAADVATQ